MVGGYRIWVVMVVKVLWLCVLCCVSLCWWLFVFVFGLQCVLVCLVDVKVEKVGLLCFIL